jgi:hypothetical protein
MTDRVVVRDARRAVDENSEPEGKEKKAQQKMYSEYHIKHPPPVIFCCCCFVCTCMCVCWAIVFGMVAGSESVVVVTPW